MSGVDSPLELAEAMLGKYCGNCHGAAAIANDNVMGAFDYVEDLEELVERAWIIPLNADQSPLLRRIRRGEMPPQGVQPRPSQAEIRAFESFIDGDDLYW